MSDSADQGSGDGYPSADLRHEKAGRKLFGLFGIEVKITSSDSIQYFVFLSLFRTYVTWKV